MKRAFVCISIFLEGLACPAEAQYLMGQSSSNYAGVHGVYLNPALAADSRMKVQVHLAGFESYLYNNYLVWEAPYSMFSMMTNSVSSEYRGPRKGIVFNDQEYLREKLNGRAKHARAGGQIIGPGVLVTLNDKNAISVNSRLRVGAAVTRTTESVARLLRNGTTNDTRIMPEDFGTQLHANTNGVAEFSATYARVLLDNEEEFWKAGVTVKRYVGLHQGHLHGTGIDYSYVPDPDNPTRGNVLLKNVSAQYGITGDGGFQDFRPTPAWLLGNAAPGSGWGADIGLVYEYRPDVRKYSYRERGEVRRDASRNKYLYRISVSLLDIGRMTYKNPTYQNAYRLTRQNRLIDENNFGNLQGSDSFVLALNETLGASEADRVNVFRVSMPKSFQASIDYHLQDNWYANATLIHSFASNSQPAFTMPSVVAASLRYESKWLDVTVPVSLADNYTRPTLGIGARAGIFYIGSDNVLPTFNIGNPKGMEFYFGAMIPIFRKAPESNLKCYPEERGGLFRGLFRRKG